MKEIVDRLHESRQIELAKSILESHGYVVSKKLTERSQEDYKGYTIYSPTEKDDYEVYISKDGEDMTDDSGKRLQFNWKKDAKSYIDSLVRENHFQVGDEMEYTGVMSGLHVSQKVLKVNSDDILVEESWISEDTGNVVKDTETYELEQDEQGNECIVVWEYSGHLGRVYPPKREDSSCKVTESTEDVLPRVKKALDDAGIGYSTRGKSEDFLVVRREDLKRASEIRDEIDPENTVHIGARA